jgi:hypothetical protein
MVRSDVGRYSRFQEMEAHLLMRKEPPNMPIDTDALGW